MEHFLAERYLTAHSLRVEPAIRALREPGPGHARLLQTLFIPDDEVCFYLFESESADQVERTGLEAGLRFDRILPVVANCGGR